MLREFLEDKLINKLNGWFMILYSNDHFVYAWMMEYINTLIVFGLVLMHLIPPRRRLF